MRLLDADRFERYFRGGLAKKVDTADVMRRMIKEDLKKFDGSDLFPPRVAHTVPFKLSPAEHLLYEDVTDYVRNQFDRAAQAADGRKRTVGFALTVLQRRLASSPEAIYLSLSRRRKRPKDKLKEARKVSRVSRDSGLDTLVSRIEDYDDRLGIGPREVQEFDDADEVEETEEEVLDLATAARTIHELEAEIYTLKTLEEQARKQRIGNQDRKWVELANILQNKHLGIRRPVDAEHLNAPSDGERPKLSKSQRRKLRRHGTIFYPGHPVVDAAVQRVLDRCGENLARGATLVDESDPDTEPRVLALLEHPIRDGRIGKNGENRLAGRRMQFVEVLSDGAARNAGFAPHLDYRPISEEERRALRSIGNVPKDAAEKARSYAAGVLAKDHVRDLRQQRGEQVEKVRALVRERLTAEIGYWDRRLGELWDEMTRKPDVRVTINDFTRRRDDLDRRLHRRMEELDRELELILAPPNIVGAALIVPAGMLLRAGEDARVPETPRTFAASPATGSRTSPCKPSSWRRWSLGTILGTCRRRTEATTSSRKTRRREDCE